MGYHYMGDHSYRRQRGIASRISGDFHDRRARKTRAAARGVRHAGTRPHGRRPSPDDTRLPDNPLLTRGRLDNGVTYWVHPLRALLSQIDAYTASAAAISSNRSNSVQATPASRQSRASVLPFTAKTRSERHAAGKSSRPSPT